MKLNICINLLFVISQNVESSKKLICKLEWKPAQSGGSIPKDALPIHEGKTFAARVFLDYGGVELYSVGSYDIERDVATFPLLSACSSASTYPVFDILTNPHACNISWPQLTDIPEFSLPIASYESNYIGRTKVKDIWVAGEIYPTFSQIVVTDVGEAITSDTYQFLTSYSPGLHLTINDFVFDLDEFGGSPSFLGIDQLVNNAAVQITQSMTHARKLIEVMSFPITNPPDVVSPSTDSSTQNILFPTFFGKSTTVTMSNTYRETVLESKTIITETEVSLIKELSVPPYSSVTVCSTVTIMEDISAPYTAKGVYTGAGLTPPEILAILNEDNIEAKIEDGQVVVDIKGVFNGALAMNSKFYAEPSDDAINCLGVAKLRDLLKSNNTEFVGV